MQACIHSLILIKLFLVLKNHIIHQDIFKKITLDNISYLTINIQQTLVTIYRACEK